MQLRLELALLLQHLGEVRLAAFRRKLAGLRTKLRSAELLADCLFLLNAEEPQFLSFGGSVLVEFVDVAQVAGEFFLGSAVLVGVELL